MVISDLAINNRLWDNYLTYTKKVGDVNFTGLLGYSYQSFEFSDSRATAQNFSQVLVEPKLEQNIDAFANNAGGADRSVVNNSSNRIDELQSYFLRANVSFKDKYVLTASYRLDGSTRFGNENVYGSFPSFALKWRLSEENFIPKNIFSDLGLRIGWGVTGNQEFGYNLWSQSKRFNDKTINSENGNLEAGNFANISFNNFDLSWESTTQTNIGLDFGFVDNRISGSVEWYDRRTDDLLLRVEAAQPATQPFNWFNIPSDLQNTGIELTLNLAAIVTKDLKWNVSLNGAYNKNLLKNLGGALLNTGAINGQGLSGAYAQRIAEGYPLGSFFLREFGGFGNQDNTIYPNGDVQDFVGKSGLPNFNAGITNSLSFKGFDFSVFLNGVFGAYIYNNTANALFTKGALNAGRNVTRDVLTSTEGAFNSPDVSTRFLESGDFVRLANLTFGYNLPLGKDSKIRAIRFTVTGQNILTFTNYSGQDPEVNTNKQIDGIPSIGIDYTAYPRAKTWTLGANISF
ncbi:MAG: TonB-dependent receptor [Saprospiraceae bacterium]|nr:TonB-dependent receptor [Saprospiraceae bacterium]